MFTIFSRILCDIILYHAREFSLIIVTFAYMRLLLIIARVKKNNYIYWIRIDLELDAFSIILSVKDITASKKVL